MPKRTSGLYPVHLHAEHTGRVTFRGSANTVTVSALGDSFYEYLLKCWLQAGGGPGFGSGSSGRAEHARQYLRMYREASNAILRHLYVPAVPSQRASGGGWAYVGASLPTGFSPRMDHLACFLPGMLALGVHRGAVTGTDAAWHLAAAKDLAETCVQVMGCEGWQLVCGMHVSSCMPLSPLDSHD
jgi:hypothetical protein